MNDARLTVFERHTALQQRLPLPQNMWAPAQPWWKEALGEIRHDLEVANESLRPHFLPKSMEPPRHSTNTGSKYDYLEDPKKIGTWRDFKKSVKKALGVAEKLAMLAALPEMLASESAMAALQSAEGGLEASALTSEGEALALEGESSAAVAEAEAAATEAQTAASAETASAEATASSAGRTPHEEFVRLKQMAGSPERGHELERIVRGLGNARRRLTAGNELRVVDASGPGFLNFSGKAFDFELKMYKGVVSLSPRIRAELVKDAFLLRTEPSYNPVWVFADGAPSRGLRLALDRLGIPYQIW